MNYLFEIGVISPHLFLRLFKMTETRNATRSLEGILILSDPSRGLVKDRVRTAVDYAQGREGIVYLACGGKTPYLSSRYQDECQITQDCLREQGANVKNIAIERESQDTTGNILLSLEQFEGDSIAVVSNQNQLERARKIIEAGKSQGHIKKDLKVNYVPVESTLGERFYEKMIGNLTRRQVTRDLKPIIKQYGFLSAVLKSLLIKTRDFVNSFCFGPFWGN